MRIKLKVEMKDFYKFYYNDYPEDFYKFYYNDCPKAVSKYIDWLFSFMKFEESQPFSFKRYWLVKNIKHELAEYYNF